jgi:hypothetical protein
MFSFYLSETDQWMAEQKAPVGRPGLCQFATPMFG